jgi:ABC-type lipoprotein release transport system permease subunit
MRPYGLPASYAWRNLLARKASTAVTLVAVGLSVMVYVVMAATADGIELVASGTGEPENLIVFSEGATSLEASRLAPAAVEVIRQLPGIARDERGEPLASVELLAVRGLPRRGAAPGDPAGVRYTPVRGVTPEAFAVHPRVRVVRGRLPREPGEVLLGRLLLSKLGGLSLGDEIPFGAGALRVVGVFEARGQIFEGEVWAPLAELMAELDTRDASAVVVRVAEPRALPAALAAIERSKRVSASVEPERGYYEEIRRASTAFAYLGRLIGAILGLGAIAAGMNTLYAAMSRRVREMGTLRALGFARRAVGGSLLLESALLGLAGGLVGLALATAFDGVALSLMGLAFELDVRPSTLARGAVLALGIGVAGGLLPARAASRLEIVDALRRV